MPQHNPPAFPVMDGDGGGNTWNRSDGLSMRDYFAAAALTGLLSNMTHREIARSVEPDRIDATAELAYCYADAMMLERNTICFDDGVAADALKRECGAAQVATEPPVPQPLESV